MGQKILFLGTSLVGALYIKKACILLGYEPVFVLNPDEYSGEPRKAIDACEVISVDDLHSVDKICSAILTSGIKNIIGITSFLDELFQTVLAVADKLEITYRPDCALAKLSDKTTVQRMASEYSPPSLKFTSETLTDRNIADFFKENREYVAFILKPPVSSGAVGIQILKKDPIPTVDDIQKLISASGIEGASTQVWMIQPRVPGQLCSLEGYIKGDVPYFIGFSRRVRDDLTEVANEFPVDDILSDPIKDRCKEAVKKLVSKSKYQNGYFHCEFIVNEKTSFLIDPNMGRLSGGAFVQHLSLYYGKNPEEILAHVIHLGIGIPPISSACEFDLLYARAAKKMTLAINYCSKIAGTIHHIHTPAHKITRFLYHTSLISTGREVSPAGSSDNAWIGFVAGFTEDVKDFAKDILITITHDGKMETYPAHYLLEEKTITVLPPSGISDRLASLGIFGSPDFDHEISTGTAMAIGAAIATFLPTAVAAGTVAIAMAIPAIRSSMQKRGRSSTPSSEPPSEPPSELPSHDVKRLRHGS